MSPTPGYYDPEIAASMRPIDQGQPAPLVRLSRTRRIPTLPPLSGLSNRPLLGKTQTESLLQGGASIYQLMLRTKLGFGRKSFGFNGRDVAFLLTGVIHPKRYSQIVLSVLCALSFKQISELRHLLRDLPDTSPTWTRPSGN